MNLKTNIKNLLIVVLAGIVLSACATQKKSGKMSGDVYSGTDTIEYLATGVKDRVFFASNKTMRRYQFDQLWLRDYILHHPHIFQGKAWYQSLHPLS